MDQIELLSDWIHSSENIVAFTGAGVSTESHIPDFRSRGGVYEEIQKSYGRPPEILLSHDFMKRHPDIFCDYLRKYLVFPDAQPNPAHRVLAMLEKAGKVSCVITQNIDGLHTKAGSRNVCELHGSIYRNYCMKCGKRFELEYVLKTSAVPLCDECGGIVRPDVVLYGESLDRRTLQKAAEAIAGADLMLVMGTSLAVYPAAGLLEYFEGRHMVLINKSETPWDGRADLVIHAPAGETLEKAMRRLY